MVELGKHTESLTYSCGSTSLSSQAYFTVARVAKQSVRCILHQYTDNLIFPKIFMLKIEGLQEIVYTIVH